jgi:hypothetical protein
MRPWHMQGIKTDSYRAQKTPVQPYQVILTIGVVIK